MTWGKREDAQLKKNDPTMIKSNQLLIGMPNTKKNAQRGINFPGKRKFTQQ
jgi:hypothetical protein